MNYYLQFEFHVYQTITIYKSRFMMLKCSKTEIQ